jgi:hypothetical protein
VKGKRQPRRKNLTPVAQILAHLDAHPFGFLDRQDSPARIERAVQAGADRKQAWQCFCKEYSAAYWLWLQWILGFGRVEQYNAHLAAMQKLGLAKLVPPIDDIAAQLDANKRAYLAERRRAAEQGEALAK